MGLPRAIVLGCTPSHQDLTPFSGNFDIFPFCVVRLVRRLVADVKKGVVDGIVRRLGAMLTLRLSIFRLLAGNIGEYELTMNVRGCGYGINVAPVGQSIPLRSARPSRVAVHSGPKTVSTKFRLTLTLR